MKYSEIKIVPVGKTSSLVKVDTFIPYGRIVFSTMNDLCYLEQQIFNVPTNVEQTFWIKPELISQNCEIKIEKRTLQILQKGTTQQERGVTHYVKKHGVFLEKTHVERYKRTYDLEKKKFLQNAQKVEKIHAQTPSVVCQYSVKEWTPHLCVKRDYVEVGDTYGSTQCNVYGAELRFVLPNSVVETLQTVGLKEGYIEMYPDKTGIHQMCPIIVQGKLSTDASVLFFATNLYV